MPQERRSPHSFKRRTDQFDPLPRVTSPSTLPATQILDGFVLGPRCAARCAVRCHLMYTDFSRAVLYTHGRGSRRATFSMCEVTPSYLRRIGHRSSSATDA